MELNFAGLWKKCKARMARDKKFELAVYVALLVLLLLLMLSLRTEKTAEARKGGEGADLEQKLEETLRCMRGVGDVRVMLTCSEDAAQVRGVIVVAEGAADIATRLRIEDAVQTVLGLETKNVDVFEMTAYEEEK